MPKHVAQTQIQKVAIFDSDSKKYYEILTLYECVEKLSMIIGCNI